MHLVQYLSLSSGCSSIVFHMPTIQIFACCDLSLYLLHPSGLLLPLASTGPSSGHWLPTALSRSPGALGPVLTFGSQARFLRSLRSLILLFVCLLPAPGALAPALRFGSQEPPLGSLQCLILLSVCILLDIHITGTLSPVQAYTSLKPAYTTFGRSLCEFLLPPLLILGQTPSRRPFDFCVAVYACGRLAHVLYSSALLTNYYLNT